MPKLHNLTRFSAVDLLSLTKEGRRRLVVCVAARFSLPRPGDRAGIPALADEQLPPPLADVYLGEPGKSSLCQEGQAAYFRPGTDIYLTGRAWAPRGRPTTAVRVEVRVGPCQKALQVLGDRRWMPAVGGLKISSPKAFESMPLVYERAFGGSSVAEGRAPAQWEPRNPVGCGIYSGLRAAAGQPLPNLEDPRAPITDIESRPDPQGVGPVARNWQPRRQLAGSYDDRWVEQRAPLWPDDFDERFFCAAAPGLTTPRHLTGGEPVVLAGVSPDGPFQFQLPTLRLRATASFRNRQEKVALALDAIHFEPDEVAFTMIWRAGFAVDGDLHGHQLTTVRELQTWESAPP